MKKTTNKVFTSLLVCMLTVTAFALKGCKDESDSIEAKPFKVTRLKGTLKFDEESQRYVIYPKNVAYPFESTFNHGSNTIYISNMADEYESLEGDVVFSGTVKRLYTIENPHVCIVQAFFSIELSELMPEEVESRSLPNDSLAFYCPTPSPAPPAWYFTRSLTELNYNTSSL